VTIRLNLIAAALLGAATIPPKETCRPLAEGGCDLVKGAAQ